MKEKFYIRLTTTAGDYFRFYQADKEDHDDHIVITSYHRDGTFLAKDVFYKDEIEMYRQFPYDPNYGKEKGRRVGESSRGREVHRTDQVQGPEVGRGIRSYGPLRKAWSALVSFLDINKDR